MLRLLVNLLIRIKGIKRKTVNYRYRDALTNWRVVPLYTLLFYEAFPRKWTIYTLDLKTLIINVVVLFVKYVFYMYVYVLIWYVFLIHEHCMFVVVSFLYYTNLQLLFLDNIWKCYIACILISFLTSSTS